MYRCIDIRYLVHSCVDKGHVHQCIYIYIYIDQKYVYSWIDIDQRYQIHSC